MIEVASVGSVAHVVLGAPPANSFDDQRCRELRDCFERLDDDFKVGAVVISSGLRYFSLGADVRAIDVLDQSGRSAFIESIRSAFETVASMRMPVVAAVDGPAIGGGLELALACDLRIASPRSSFGTPEVRLGLIPGAGGTQRLGRAVGDALALDLMLTGRTLDAQEALAAMLVSRVVDDPVEEALAVAQSIASYPRDAVAHIRRAVSLSHAREPAQGVEYERRAVLELINSDAATRLITAFAHGAKTS